MENRPIPEKTINNLGRWVFLFSPYQIFQLLNIVQNTCIHSKLSGTRLSLLSLSKTPWSTLSKQPWSTSSSTEDTLLLLDLVRQKKQAENEQKKVRESETRQMCFFCICKRKKRWGEDDFIQEARIREMALQQKQKKEAARGVQVFVILIKLFKF